MRESGSSRTSSTRPLRARKPRLSSTLCMQRGSRKTGRKAKSPLGSNRDCKTPSEVSPSPPGGLKRSPIGPFTMVSPWFSFLKRPWMTRKSASQVCHPARLCISLAHESPRELDFGWFTRSFRSLRLLERSNGRNPVLEHGRCRLSSHGQAFRFYSRAYCLRTRLGSWVRPWRHSQSVVHWIGLESSVMGAC